MLKTRVLALGILVGLTALALPLTASAQNPPCEWLAGDFHVHTVYSHDAYGGPGDDNTGPDEFYTFGWTPGEQAAIAESRGLDYIAITDHDNEGGGTTAQSDPAWGSRGLIWVPDYENSAPNAGHAQMHGALQEHYEFYEAAPTVVETAARLRSNGGAFQINHPADMDWHDDAGNYKFPGFAPDSLEVWNIGAWFYEPPMPATNDHEFPLTMWDQEFLDLGYHVAATGGSDNHWRSTTAAQGVGQPTTWVCAADRTWQGIVEGVKANHTTVSHQPPAYMGARAFLSADGNGDGTFESILGDTVTPGSKIQAVVENGEGAWLQLVTNGGRVLAKDPVTSFNFTKSYDVPADSTWVRAEVFYEDGEAARSELQPLCDLSEEFTTRDPVFDDENTYCENRLAVIALTSPIYFEASDPATTLTYDGDTEVRAGSNATLAATLLDSSGAPLPGQSVTFTFRDETFTATTDDAGRASVQTRVQGPPGSYEIVSDFAGTDTYDASHDHDVIAVTTGAR